MRAGERAADVDSIDYRSGLVPIRLDGVTTTLLSHPNSIDERPRGRRDTNNTRPDSF